MCSLFSGYPIFKFLALFTPDAPTYSWPWVNTGSGNHIITFSMVCPCDLLILIQYANVTGNWTLLRLKGNLMSDVMGIFGIHAIFFANFPLRISASIKCLCSFLTINLFPLHNPCAISQYFLKALLVHWFLVLRATIYKKGAVPKIDYFKYDFFHTFFFFF